MPSTGLDLFTSSSLLSFLLEKTISYVIVESGIILAACHQCSSGAIGRLSCCCYLVCSVNGGYAPRSSSGDNEKLC